MIVSPVMGCVTGAQKWAGRNVMLFYVSCARLIISVESSCVMTGMLRRRDSWAPSEFSTHVFLGFSRSFGGMAYSRFVKVLLGFGWDFAPSEIFEYI